MNPSEVAAPNTYTAGRLRTAKNPPMVGPTMLATCWTLVRHLIAFSKSARGTSFGSNAVRAGRPSVEAVESQNSSRYIHQIDAFECDTHANPSDAAVIPTIEMAITLRLSNRSARNPAGRINAIIGIAATRPTSPKRNASFVR